MESLSKAMGHWLEFKSLAGFEPLLSEALLTVGVSEYLIGNSWKLRGEVDLRSLLKSDRIPAGYFNYDIIAEKAAHDEIVVIELKFLKSAKSRRVENKVSSTPASRLMDDVFKLAYIPASKPFKRYLVLASRSYVEPSVEFLRLIDGGLIRIRKQSDSEVEKSLVSARNIPSSDNWSFDEGIPEWCEIINRSKPNEGMFKVSVFEIVRHK